MLGNPYSRAMRATDLAELLADTLIDRAGEFAETEDSDETHYTIDTWLNSERDANGSRVVTVVWLPPNARTRDEGVPLVRVTFEAVGN